MLGPEVLGTAMGMKTSFPALVNENEVLFFPRIMSNRKKKKNAEEGTLQMPLNVYGTSPVTLMGSKSRFRGSNQIICLWI